MAVNLAGIKFLPNEILIFIFSSFPTRALLPFTPTCRRFHDVILRILQCRLLDAASNKDHKLILECYHPSARFYTPYLFCDYISTPGLKLENDFAGDGRAGRLGELSRLYSYFRPLKPDKRRAARPHPAGGWLVLPPLGIVDKHKEFVCQEVHLDSHELFSQLVTTTNLVKLGPKPGIFRSSVNIGEGLTRVWRHWLSDRISYSSQDARAQSERVCEREKRLLWADSANQVGLRMNVAEKNDVLEPVVLLRGEDPPVSYTLQYEELAVRTSHLLLMMEQAMEEETTQSGKAVVIGSWFR